MNKNINRSIQKKYGTYNLILILLVVFIIASICFILANISKNNRSISTNNVDLYSLSNITKDEITNLSSDFELYVVSDNSGEYDSYSVEICKSFSEYSKKITMKKINKVTNPELLSSFNSNTISDYSIIIKNSISNQFSMINYNSLICSESFSDELGNDLSRTIYNGEKLIINTMLNLDNNKYTIYCLVGHGESSMLDYELSDSLNQVGIEVKEDLGLISSNYEIPKDCDLIFINNPYKQDLTLQELDSICNFIDNGGCIVVIYNQVDALINGSSYYVKHENLYKLLDYIGFKIEENVAYETDINYYYDKSKYKEYSIFPILNSENEVCKAFINISDNVLLDFASSISHTKENSIEYVDVLSTTDTHSEYIYEGDYHMNCKNSSVLAAISSVANQNFTSRNAVIGASYFLDLNKIEDSEIINNYALNNMTLLGNIIEYCLKGNNNQMVYPKIIETSFNKTTNNQRMIYRIIYMVAIPIAFICLGLCVTFKRRSR